MRLMLASSSFSRAACNCCRRSSPPRTCWFPPANCAGADRGVGRISPSRSIDERGSKPAILSPPVLCRSRRHRRRAGRGSGRCLRPHPRQSSTRPAGNVGATTRENPRRHSALRRRSRVWTIGPMLRNSCMQARAVHAPGQPFPSGLHPGACTRLSRSVSRPREENSNVIFGGRRYRVYRYGCGFPTAIGERSAATILLPSEAVRPV